MNNHDESLFYCDIDETSVTKQFIEPLRHYSVQQSKQVYILKKALGTNKEYSYNLTDVAIVLIPKHSVLVLSYGAAKSEELKDYELDFKEDLGFLADKFEYNKILGRVRKWPECFVMTRCLSSFNVDEYLLQEVEHQYQRRIDLLISLLIGSINSIDKVGLNEPETLLDKVKQKIILFDGQQSRFIYQPKAIWT